MKFYDFLDKAPKIGGLVIVEGSERFLADNAISLLLERLLQPAERDLNLETFSGEALDIRKVADAVVAMPFLAERRVVVVRGALAMKAAPRRELWAVAQSVPAGNTLIIEDLLPAGRKGRVESFGSLAGRSALRIDTTPSAEARRRFVEEMLASLGAKAEPRVVGALANSDAEFAAIRTDLEKLALIGGTITFDALESETLSAVDPKAYRFAGAVVEGRVREALGIAAEMFERDARGAAVPLLSAVAAEYDLLWQLARGLEPSARDRWRAGKLMALARRVGAVGARRGFEQAVSGFESVVTGRADDPRALVEILAAELAGRAENEGLRSG